MRKDGSKKGFEFDSSAHVKFDTAVELLTVLALFGKFVTTESRRIGYDLDYERILVSLVLYGPMTQGELGDIVLRSRQSTTNLVDKMEQEGLLTRTTPRRDRRINQTSITQKGRNWIKRSVPSVPNMLLQTIPLDLSERQIEQLQSILVVLRKHLLRQNGLFTGREALPGDQFGLEQLVRAGLFELTPKR